MNIVLRDKENQIAVLVKDNAALQKENDDLHRQLGFSASVKRQRSRQNHQSVVT